MLRRISSFPSTPASPRRGSFRPKGGTSIPSKASIGMPESAATSSASGTTSSDGAGYPSRSPVRAYFSSVSSKVFRAAATHSTESTATTRASAGRYEKTGAASP